MPIINLTKLTVRIAYEDGTVYQTFEPSGDKIIAETTGKQVEIDGIPVELSHVTSVKGLPDLQEGTYYIVPEPLSKVLNRADLVAPDTGPTAIRDENGNVYAVRRLFNLTIDSK